MEAKYGATLRLRLTMDYPSSENNGNLLGQKIETGVGQWFVHDGFGILWQQNVTKGAAPTLSIQIDQTNNRILGGSYDSNGNQTSSGAVFDIDNRLISINAISSGTEEYNYLVDNKRVWKKEPSGTEFVYFYCARGQKLATYQVATSPSFALNQVSVNVYLCGKLIRADGVAVASDRLGSVMGRSAAADSSSVTSHDYFPSGAEIGSASAGNRDKFGTYHRDQSTGLDYAGQRCYSSTNGRFMTADPYEASGGAGEPGSWNRYPYVGGDPVNYTDPSELVQLKAPEQFCFPWCPLLRSLLHNRQIHRILFDSNAWKLEGTRQYRAEYFADQTTLRFREAATRALSNMPQECKELFSNTQLGSGPNASSVAQAPGFQADHVGVVQADSANQNYLTLGYFGVTIPDFQNMTVDQYHRSRKVSANAYSQPAFNSLIFVTYTSGMGSDADVLDEIWHTAFSAAGLDGDPADILRYFGVTPTGSTDEEHNQQLADWVWRDKCAVPKN